MKSWKKDYNRHKNKGLIVFFTHPGVRFMILFRLCRKYSGNPVSFIFKIWFKNMQVKYGFQIPYITEIDEGLMLNHYGNIVIHMNSIIGRNCNIAQGVTIGYVSRGKKKGCPMIGNEVWIGANAVIVGKVLIGNKVLIAPLTYVNFDVPENAVVMGNPGKIISFQGSEGYINNKI